MINPYSHEHFMKLALKEAEEALSKDEVPVGAIVVSGNQVIARGYNLTETLNDVTAHAEMQAQLQQKAAEERRAIAKAHAAEVARLQKEEENKIEREMQKRKQYIISKFKLNEYVKRN